MSEERSVRKERSLGYGNPFYFITLGELLLSVYKEVISRN